MCPLFLTPGSCSYLANIWDSNVYVFAWEMFWYIGNAFDFLPHVQKFFLLFFSYLLCYAYITRIHYFIMGDDFFSNLDSIHSATVMNFVPNNHRSFFIRCCHLISDHIIILIIKIIDILHIIIIIISGGLYLIQTTL